MTTGEDGGRRGRGRPRSEQARRAIMRATAQLLEEGGYGRLTMEGIAQRAGVSKQTVYRWWSTKSAVVLTVLNEAAAAVAPLPDGGSLRADLQALIRAVATGMRLYAKLLTGLIAEAQLDEDFAETFRTGFLARRRAVLLEVLDRGRARGEIRPEVHLDLLADLVFGVLWYRLLAHGDIPDPQGPYADQLTEVMMTLCRAS